MGEEIPGVDDTDDDDDDDETPGVDGETPGVDNSEADNKAEGETYKGNEQKEDNKETVTRASGSMSL